MTESRTAAEMAEARTTPHESKTRPLPEPNLCAECGLSPWDDIHISPSRGRTAAASKARHLNALRRKAPEYVAALRELGYTVTEPKTHRAAIRISDPTTCVVCGGDPTDEKAHES